MVGDKLTHTLCGLAAVLALAGCGRQDEATTLTGDTAQSAAEAENTTGAQPATSTPSPHIAMLEQQLQELGARQTDQGLVLVLSSATFSSGEASFEPMETTRLDRLGDLLRARPELQVRVIGHTDSRGSETLNEVLSRDRAQAVKQALIQREYIDAERILVKGAGESNPVASNATEEGRAQNRRVEVVVTDRTGRYASSDTMSPTG